MIKKILLLLTCISIISLYACSAKNEVASAEETTTTVVESKEEAKDNSSEGGNTLNFDTDTSNNVPATYADVAYGDKSSSQVLNIYIPDADADANGYPTIILVHGGGFAMESQNEVLIQPVIRKALEKNYAVVSVDYRKSSEISFPGALSDVKATVRWIKKNADTYKFNKDNLTIWGESAGGYLAAMTAITPYDTDLDKDEMSNSDFSSLVNNLVDFYGPIEFYTMDDEFIALGQDDDANHSSETSFESKYLGQALEKDKDYTYKTYWENHISNNPSDFKIKAWIQAGTSDDNVPYTQSTNLASRLAKVIGEENIKYGLIEDAEHMDDKFYTDENLDAIFEFIK